MGFYSVRWKHSAGKELKKLPKPIIAKVVAAVEKLAENPFPAGSKKIIGAKYIHRIRIGNYRVVYSVESGKLLIIIIRAAHRGNVYKKL